MAESKGPVTVRMKAGVDVGNGYTKAMVQAEGEEKRRFFDVQSAVAYTNDEIVPMEPRQDTMADLANQLDATVVGGGIKARDAARMYYGIRAVRSDRPTMRFDISSREPKSTESLEYLMVADVLASAAVQSVWEATGEIPDDIAVEAEVGLALPISDWIEHQDAFRRTLEEAPYRVTVNNFGRAVEVKVDIVRAKVGAEGVVGNFALFCLPDEVFNADLANARAKGQHIDEDVDAQMLHDFDSFVSIDIGEGTVNMPVFIDGRLSKELSSSVPSGYGTVLEHVVDLNRNTPIGASIPDRKALEEFLLRPNLRGGKRQKQEALQMDVDRECGIFARDIQMEFSKIWRQVGLTADVVYVYGGGSTPMQPHLEPELRGVIDMEGYDSVPIVFLDSSYSRDLNMHGLYRMLEG